MIARNADETEISAVERIGGGGGPDIRRTSVVGIREEKIHIVLEGLRGEEIIRLVEQSHIGVRPTLAKLGIPKTTFYRRYDRYLAFG